MANICYLSGYETINLKVCYPNTIFPTWKKKLNKRCPSAKGLVGDN